MMIFRSKVSFIANEHTKSILRCDGHRTMARIFTIVSYLRQNRLVFLNCSEDLISMYRFRQMETLH